MQQVLIAAPENGYNEGATSLQTSCSAQPTLRCSQNQTLSRSGVWNVHLSTICQNCPESLWRQQVAQLQRRLSWFFNFQGFVRASLLLIEDIWGGGAKSTSWFCGQIFDWGREKYFTFYLFLVLQGPLCLWRWLGCLLSETLFFFYLRLHGCCFLLCVAVCYLRLPCWFFRCDSTYPCQSVGQWLRVSDLEIAITSASLAFLLFETARYLRPPF